MQTAGAVHLLDDGFKRRRVALLSGDNGNEMQPLLQPLYYISRALQPYADLVEPRNADLATSLPELLTSNPSVIIMPISAVCRQRHTRLSSNGCRAAAC